MFEFLLKIKTVAILSTAIAIGSASFTTAAYSASKHIPSVKQAESQFIGSAKQRTSNSTDYSWGHPCNDYSPLGSINVRIDIGKKGPIDRVACELAKKKMMRK